MNYEIKASGGAMKIEKKIERSLGNRKGTPTRGGKETAEKEKQKLADKARQEAYERKQLELLKKKFEQNS